MSFALNIPQRVQLLLCYPSQRSFMKVLFVVVLFSLECFGQGVSLQTVLAKSGVPLECRGILHTCKRVSVTNKPSPSDPIQSCLVPIITGESVAGVNVPSSVLKTCKKAANFLVETEKVHSRNH
jgi:hypothetical protein